MELHFRLLRHVIDTDGQLNPECYNRVFLGSPITERYFHEYDAKSNSFTDTCTAFVFQWAKDYFNEFKRPPSDDAISEDISDNEQIDLFMKRALKQTLHNIRQYKANPSDTPMLISRLVDDYKRDRDTYHKQKSLIIREEKGIEASIEYQIAELVKLKNASASSNSAGALTGAQFADSIIEQMKHDAELVKPAARFGFRKWDRYTGGMYAGTVTAIGAGLSVGKSWFLHETGLINAIDLGLNVVIWNLEMLQEQIAMRIVCRQTGIPLNKLKRGYMNLSAEEQALFDAAQQGIRDAGDRILFLDQRRCQTFTQVKAEMLQHFGNKHVPLVVADYLDKIKPSRGRWGEQHDRIALVSSEAKEFALENSLAVYTATQGNRQANKKKDKAGDAKSDPTLDDLSYMQVAKDVDTVIMLTEDADNPYEAPDPDDDEAGTPGIINARFIRGRNHGKQRREPFRMSVEFATGTIAEASDFSRSEIGRSFRREAA